jgi:hypothetical protein
MRLRDLAWKAVTDEDDLAILEDDLAVLIEAVPPLRMADEPARGQQDAAFRAFGGAQAHGAVLIETPSRATMLPRLTTRRLGERVTIASATVSPGRITKSAVLPSVSP